MLLWTAKRRNCSEYQKSIAVERLVSDVVTCGAIRNQSGMTVKLIQLLFVSIIIGMAPWSEAGLLQTVSTPRVSVSHQARSIQPGEVVELVVSATRSVVSVEAKAFDQSILLYPSSGQMVWRGLIGVDLDVEVREHFVSVTVITGDDTPMHVRYPLTVVPKQFATRQLTVAPHYVNPGAEALARIQKEAARTTRIFETQTSQRFWRGSFLAPVPGKATSSFGRRSVFNGQPRSPHSGADFRAVEGTPVTAPNRGRVVLRSDLYFSGNCVILDHGLGLYSFFAHLSGFAVEEGDLVDSGDVVGYVGATGRVTGPHLHWTVRLNTARVDPLSLMEVLFDDSATY
jgi:murein DD-endopeptidase MepM/ murein hydrolase activator NlpD